MDETFGRMAEEKVAEPDIADRALHGADSVAAGLRLEVDLALPAVERERAADRHGSLAIARELQTCDGKHDGPATRPLEGRADIGKADGLHAVRINQAVNAIKPLEGGFEVVRHIGNA